MKRIIVIAVSIFAALSASIALADGITWTYTVSNGEASVGGGSMESPGIPETTTGAITIPATLGGYPVTSIGDWAFYDCSGLTSVTIPDSVTSIGDFAISCCSGLTSVTIPDSVTSIGKGAFFCCLALFDETTIAGVALVDGWVIGNLMIEPLPGDLNLTGIRGMEDSAFENCNELTSVTIGNSVTSIAAGAFKNCSGLTSVTIQDGVTSIGEQAFYGCSSLASVTFNGNAPIVYGNAFANVADGCVAIVPRNSTGWGVEDGEMWNGLVLSKTGNMLNDIIDLSHYYGFSEGKGSYADFEWTYAELEDYSEHYYGSSGNLPWVFQFGADKHDTACIPVTGCGEEKVVPVITLGTATKADGIVATVLTDAEFAAKLHIGEYEFEKDDDEYVYEDEEAKVNYEYPCSVWPDGELVEGRQWIMVSLKNVKIGENGFFTPKTFTVGIAGTNQKTPMITISPDDELPSATRFTPLSVFGFDVKMNGLSFPDANWIWCSFAPDFSLWEGVHNGDVDQIPYVYDYDDDEDARDFTVPVPSAGELYIKIDDMGKWDVQLEGLKFSGSAYGGSVRTVESVQSGYWIVVNAQSDGDLTIDLGDVEKLIVNGMWFRPSTVDETQCLATEAWYREEITVANDITMANYRGFVTGLGLVAFGDTASLVCYPNEGEELDHWEFLNCTAPAGATTNDTTLTFTVTESLYNAIGASEDPIKRVIVRPVFRKATTPIPTWTITIENGILTGVELNGATEVVIPDGVTGIGDNVFRYCRGLTSVTIPDSVTSIGEDAFYCCSGLTSVTIPDSVTSIGSGAFYGCSGLTSVTIPDSVTSIESAVFCECSGLTSVTIPDSVTSIGGGAFSDCIGLTSVTIPDSVTSIGDCAFEDCSRLTRVDMSNFDIAFGIRCFERCPAYVGVFTGLRLGQMDMALGRRLTRLCLRSRMWLCIM